MPTELPSDLGDGAFRVRDALRAGATEKRLRGRDLASPFHGVRSVGGDSSVDSRARALLAILPPTMIFSHITAARLWRGIPLPAEEAEEPIHVSVRPPRRPMRRRGVVGHTIADPLVTVRLRFGLRLPDAASLFCQLAESLDHADLVAVGDALVRTPGVYDESDPRPWLSLDALRNRAAGFRGRGALAARSAAAEVRDGSDSRQETLLRLAIIAAGLPEPELNVVLRDADRVFVARVDLYFRAWSVVVEYDGAGHARTWAKDARRHDELAALGLRTVRIIGDEFVPHPERSIARVRRALTERGWPG